MASYIANVSFEHSGVRIQAGQVIDSTHYLFTMFPSRFTAVNSVATLGTVNPSVAGQLWNNGGTLMISGG